MAYKKYARKVAKKAGRYVKKRYFKGKGYGDPKIATMARDVMRLKQMVNAEKQNIESAATNEFDLAQYNGVSTTGARQIEIMPTVFQGYTENQRKGDSLKVCSWVLKIQAYNNGNLTLAGMNYTFYLVRQPVNPVANANVLDQFLEPNPFSGVIDGYSNRNYEHYKDWVVMGIIKGKFKANESADAGQGSKTNMHTLARKQEFHIRYDKNTTTINNNRMQLICVASDGDRSGTNKMFFKYAFKVFYYDN